MLFPFNRRQTPPSAELPRQDQHEASPRPCAAGLSLLPAAFLNRMVSAELNQFSGPFPISLILQRTALRVQKGSVHVFKGTQAWRALLGCHCCDRDVLALAFPLFLKLFYSFKMFSCVSFIWWGTLKGSFSEAILEDSLHTAMWFLTLTLELWSSLVKWCPGQLLTLISGLLLVQSCGWDFLVITAVQCVQNPWEKIPWGWALGQGHGILCYIA